MLRAFFEPAKGPPKELEPVEYIELRGKAVQLPDGSEVGQHQGGLWRVDVTVYLALKVQQPVRLHFQHLDFNRELKLGPYDSLEMVDNSMWAGSEHPRLVALFDEFISCWHIQLAPAIAMPIVTIRPAASS